jgi:hypothetical protein
MAAGCDGNGAGSGGVRKLKKVLETRTDSPDLLSSLGAHSTYAQNNPQARRNLNSLR